MEWQKTTFGELKAGDWYAIKEPTKYMIELHCRATDPANDDKSETVYRLVSPEREALEKIRPLLQEVVDTYNAPREVSQNFDWIEFVERATAALEVKQ